MIRKLRGALVRGLVVVLPIALTLWLLWWLASSTEALLQQLITLFIPERHYRPGMGIAAALVLLLVAGVMVNALLIRRLLAAWEAFLDRIPLVKTIYAAIRDFLQLLPAGGKRRELRRVVVARLGDARLIGFVTQDHVEEFGVADPAHELVAVYFPFSYQIGGYTALLPRRLLEPLDMRIEDAMRLVLTGGLSGAAPPRP